MSMLVYETGKCIGKMRLQKMKKIKKSLSEINFDRNWSCFLAACFITFFFWGGGGYLFLDWKNLILLTFVFF